MTTRETITESYFTGTIERVIFENPSNFYKILLLDLTDTDTDFEEADIIVTGTMADVIEGENYRFYGHLVTHPKYGQQVQMTRYERSKPTISGLVSYFSSEQFKGIGRKTAEKIVALYGDNAIDDILAQPEKLETISGLSAKNRKAFLDKIRLNYGTEIILGELARYGIPNKLAFQIHDTYKEETLELIQKNPYRLVEDITGIGFTIADRIAENLGIASDAPQRFRAGLLYSLLNDSMETGNTYIEARDLLSSSLALLETSRQIELDPALIAEELTNLIEEDKVQQIETKIFDNSLFFAEQGIQKHLMRLLEKQAIKKFPDQTIQKILSELEDEWGISYDPIQKEAIMRAINSPVFLLTGGPGTGKTTIINGIIAVYAKLHKIPLKKASGEIPILLAAPTGRAARRMNELTGLTSATIHRHLGLAEDQSESYLDDYLDADFVIVDEFSMVDTWLANQLLSHIATTTQLLIVGDSDQLPSVSPGQVLADLLSIPSIPSIRLEKIYRQSEESTIVTLASQIREGILPADFREKKADRSYFEVGSEQVAPSIERIITAATKSGIPKTEIQILAPMYRGAAGIDQLNRMAQNLLNPLLSGQLEFAFNDLTFRSGDRVIHLVNDAESNVFNGDLGYITDLLAAKYTDSKQDELTIQFDGQEVTYPRNEWYKITLAYAMSIHKSQGSEFQVVILPMTMGSQRMLQRNLLYTAITRSKSKLILLGEIRAFDYAIHREGTLRQTYLKERFEATPEPAKKASTPSPDTPSPSESKTATAETAPSKDYILTPENYLTIDPMIGVTEEDLTQFFR